MLGRPANQTECSTAYCLFNVTADPCEYHNLAEQHPDVVAELVQRLKASVSPQLCARKGLCGAVPLLPGAFARRHGHCGADGVTSRSLPPHTATARTRYPQAFQDTAVPAVKPDGCAPILINVTGLDIPAWQPCDAPNQAAGMVLAGTI